MQENIENNLKLIKAIGRIIAKYRKKQKKSVYQISAECHVPKSTWHNIEKSLVKDIHITNLWKISEGLDIPIETIIMELKQELGSDFSLSGL